MRDRIVWSLDGWRDAWRNEPSLRSWVYANVISVIAAFALPLSGTERLILIVLGILILAAELMNTGLERLTDLVTTEQNDLARRSKDCGSAAVALTAIAGGVAWVWILIGLAI